MGLSVATGNALLNGITSKFNRIYLIDDPLNTITMDSSVVGLAIIINGFVPLTWKAAQNGNYIETDNTPTSNPIMFAIPSGKNVMKYAITDSTGVIYAINTLTTQVNFANNNAYYIDELAISVQEV